MDRDLAARFSGLRPTSLGAILLTTSLSLGLTTEALGLGVGRPVTQSALGQPLNLVFPIRLNAGETLGPDCVHAEVLAGDARLPANLVQLQLEGESEASVRAVRLQSVVQIDEPIVSINLSVGCPARFTRQFTAFIDPPSARALAVPVEPDGPELPTRNYSPALRAALATAEAKPAALLAQPAPGPALPVLTPVPAPASAPKPSIRTARPVPAAAAGDVQLAEAAAPAPPRPAKKKTPKAAPKPSADVLAGARSGSPPAKPSGPRLQLDPAEPVALAASQAASAPEPNAELTAALARLQKLEENLGRLQQENRSTQDKLLALRSQLEEAQSQRYLNPLVLGLGLSVLGLAAAVFYLWRSRRSEREMRDSAWWNEVQNEQRESRLSQLGVEPAAEPGVKPVAVQAAQAAPAAAAIEPEPAEPAEALVDFVNTMPPYEPEPVAKAADFERHTLNSALIEREERTMSLPNLALVEPAHEPLSIQLVDAHEPTTVAGAIDPAQPVTVEELIDLEQQVDFFLVLGQDEAAIELLQARIDTGMASALPYLKLLEIHQRRADELAFADLTARFAARFQALPPTWGADLNDGRPLEAYERVLQRIQFGWNDSGASMALLQKLLSRGSEDATQQQGFDLPAYRDLLLLYGVARDLSEHDVRGEQIDLFLPLETGGHGGSGMMATMIWQGSPAAASSHIDLDISLDDPAPEKG